MISRSAVHAIRALSALSTLPPGVRMGTATLARKIDAPPNYLGKLLQTLARHGLVDSRKGLGGGFSLARMPGEIRLLDVVQPMEQVERFKGCFLGRAECSDADPCALHDRWADLRDRYLAILSETTLSDLLETGRDAVDLTGRPEDARSAGRASTDNPKPV